MTNRLSIASRILVAFASGALIAVFFLPVWRIDLFAPQYPEGLTMNIWINKLSGDTDIINGLNHYIGMKKINASMFPEFRFLPYVVCFYMLLGLIVAITGRPRLLLFYIILTVIGGFLAMYDFYSWGYDYGHHLDPNAPIQVPGLSYQPPLFGHKRLLNFDAYSFPHIGGWVVIAAAGLAFVVWLVEKFKHRLVKGQSTVSKTVVTSIIALVFLNSCSSKPRPIAVGKDNCDFCKMTIMDTKYAGEIVSKKGKVFVFDDLHCLLSFLPGQQLGSETISGILVTDYNKSNTFLIAENAWFVKAESIKSPMSGHTVAFATKAAAESFMSGIPGAEILSWKEIQNKK